MQRYIAKSTLLPFEVIAINEAATCAAVLPLKDSLAKYDPTYKDIIELQRKMLRVLDLPNNKLALITIRYPFTLSFQSDILTKKLLKYYRQLKVILQFSNLNFLDLEYLSAKKIFTKVIMHPEYLLENAEYKRQAYQDLLLCKSKLAAIF